MMTKKIYILVVDDEPSYLNNFNEVFKEFNSKFKNIKYNTTDNDTQSIDEMSFEIIPYLRNFNTSVQFWVDNYDKLNFVYLDYHNDYGKDGFFYLKKVIQEKFGNDSQNSAVINNVIPFTNSDNNRDLSYQFSQLNIKKWHYNHSLKKTLELYQAFIENFYINYFVKYISNVALLQKISSICGSETKLSFTDYLFVYKSLEANQEIKINLLNIYFFKMKTVIKEHIMVCGKPVDGEQIKMNLFLKSVEKISMAIDKDMFKERFILFHHQGITFSEVSKKIICAIETINDNEYLFFVFSAIAFNVLKIKEFTIINGTLMVLLKSGNSIISEPKPIKGYTVVNGFNTAALETLKDNFNDLTKLYAMKFINKYNVTY